MRGAPGRVLPVLVVLRRPPLPSPPLGKLLVWAVLSRVPATGAVGAVVVAHLVVVVVVVESTAGRWMSSSAGMAVVVLRTLRGGHSRPADCSLAPDPDQNQNFRGGIGGRKDADVGGVRAGGEGSLWQPAEKRLDVQLACAAAVAGAAPRGESPAAGVVWMWAWKRRCSLLARVDETRVVACCELLLGDEGWSQPCG